MMPTYARSSKRIHEEIIPVPDLLRDELASFASAVGSFRTCDIKHQLLSIAL